jgi:uncharacterized protein (TIRG00374 family)
MKRNFIIGSLISTVFLYLALRGIQWSLLWRVLGGTRFLLLVPAVAAGLLSHYFRSYRWKFMLLSIKPISTKSLFAATMIGFMANNLLPARLGELVRADALGRREGISRTGSFATIVYERIIDVFCLLVLLWVFLMKVPGPDWLARTAVWLLAANVLLMIAMLAMERYRGLVTRIVEKLARPLNEKTRAKIHQATQGYLGGLSGMTKVHTLLPIVLTSVPVWGFAMVGIYLCFGALNMHPPLVATVAIVVLVALGSMIPSAPAFLGTTQYACVVGLGLFGVEKTEALAYSILYHAVQFFPVTILGFYYLSKSHIRLRDISKR